MTAVTVLDSSSDFIHGIPGMEMVRVLVAASGDTYQSNFTRVYNVHPSIETAPTAGNGLITATENSSTAGQIDIGIDTTNVVVSLQIWGDR